MWLWFPGSPEARVPGAAVSVAFVSRLADTAVHSAAHMSARQARPSSGCHVWPILLYTAPHMFVRQARPSSGRSYSPALISISRVGVASFRISLSLSRVPLRFFETFTCLHPHRRNFQQKRGFFIIFSGVFSAYILATMIRNMPIDQLEAVRLRFIIFVLGFSIVFYTDCGQLEEGVRWGYISVLCLFL